MNGGWLDNKTKFLCKIHNNLLVKAFGNQTSLIPLNRPIRLMFDPVNPLTTNQILLRRCWDKNPNVVSHKGIMFFTHGMMLIWKAMSLLDVGSWNATLGALVARAQGIR